MSDKLGVREFVTGRIGSQYLNTVYWSGADLLEAQSIKLPKQFVIKSNHSSGDVIVVHDINSFDWSAAAKQTALWLESDVSQYCGEWQYRWIKPKLLIEEFLCDEAGNVPLDFKIFCFHGKALYLEVDYARFMSHSQAFFDKNFSLLPFKQKYPLNSDPNLIPPPNFELILNLAESLSDGERFLRVDFYDVGKPVFGELTLHPASGLVRFDPPEWDEIFGQHI